MGHEGDEGDLADVGGLSGHVGSGEDVETPGLGVHGGVVGDEFFFDEGLFKDGVAGVGEVEAAVGGEVRAGVLMELRSLGEGEEDVEGGEGFGGLLEGGEVVADLLTEVDEEVVFEGFGTFVRAEDFLLHLLEGGSDVAFGVGHGLFALVVVGDFVDFGFGDFEKVAEDVVEFDFEGFDAGAFALGFLQFGEPVFPFARGGAKFVEFSGVSVANEVSVFG